MIFNHGKLLSDLLDNFYWLSFFYSLTPRFLYFIFIFSVTHLIELAEEKTGCSGMVVVIDKHEKIEGEF